MPTWVSVSHKYEPLIRALFKAQPAIVLRVLTLRAGLVIALVF